MVMFKQSQTKTAPPMLLILCSAFSLLVLLHTLATPIFEAPDEVWHYAYVRWIAEGHGLPALDSDESGAYQEVAQPPLYYGVAAAISRSFRDDDLATLLRHNPGFGYQAPGTSADNKNMLIHLPYTWAWTGAAGAIHATRLASWLFGLVAVAATWGLAYETTRSRRWALVTASLVAFQPQFVFLSGVVSNDSAAVALATVGLWFAVRVMRQNTGVPHSTGVRQSTGGRQRNTGRHSPLACGRRLAHSQLHLRGLARLRSSSTPAWQLTPRTRRPSQSARALRPTILGTPTPPPWSRRQPSQVP